MRRLKTVRRPPIYPKTPGHLPCSSLTHPLPLPSRRPSVSFGGFGLKLGVFVGLLIFLMVATIACDNTEPLLEPASIQESTGTSAPTPTPDGTDVSQSPSPHIDPASREAEGYAAHHGVSLEEAQNRFTLQRLAGELNAVLSDREGRTFAGLWIEHTLPSFGSLFSSLGMPKRLSLGTFKTMT